MRDVYIVDVLVKGRRESAKSSKLTTDRDAYIVNELVKGRRESA